MRYRISLVVLALAALAPSLLASCGGDDEGYPPFEMTYTMSYRTEAASTWELDYRSSNDWTKTVVHADAQSEFPLGRTARWNGERIAWAESPDGPFVEDGSPEPNPNHALPERWLGYELADLPNDFFEEIEAPRDGTRRFRNEFRIGGTDAVMGAEIVTFEVSTGFPVEYQNTMGFAGVGVDYEVLAFRLK